MTEAGSRGNGRPTASSIDRVSARGEIEHQARVALALSRVPLQIARIAIGCLWKEARAGDKLPQ